MLLSSLFFSCSLISYSVLHGLWRWKQQRIGTYYGGYDVEGLSETSLDSEEQTLLKGRDSQPVL